MSNSNVLSKISPPPRREPKNDETPAPGPVASPKFDQVKEDERVQFNKRIPRRVSDGFELLAIRTRRKVPELLAEALEILEDRYGKV